MSKAWIWEQSIKAGECKKLEIKMAGNIELVQGRYLMVGSDARYVYGDINVPFPCENTGILKVMPMINMHDLIKHYENNDLCNFKNSHQRQLLYPEQCYFACNVNDMEYTLSFVIVSLFFYFIFAFCFHVA